MHQGATDLGMSRYRATGFARHANASQRSSFYDAGHRSSDLVDRPRGHVMPEGLPQSPAFDGVLGARTLGTEVDATTGQLAVRIQQQLTARPAHQAHQLALWLPLLTPHTGAFGASLGTRQIGR